MLFARVAFLTFLGDLFEGESDLHWWEALRRLGLFDTGTNSEEVSFLLFDDRPELEHTDLFSEECITGGGGGDHRGLIPNTIKRCVKYKIGTVRNCAKKTSGNMKKIWLLDSYTTTTTTTT